jgi:CheY-like chemotaxis protein
MTSTQVLELLIAEDDTDLREILSTHLEETLNLKVHLASNGLEAIEILKTNKISLIISDLMMPIMGGKELLDYNVKKNNLPFILITATDISRDPVLSGMKTYHPSNAIFHKPFSIDLLTSHVKQIVQREIMKY